MNTRVVNAVLILIGVIAYTGCSRIQEPWTSGYSPPKDQLVRSSAEQKALRERLIEQSVGLRQMNE